MWESGTEIPTFSMSFGTWLTQFLGVTSVGVTITKFFSVILLDYQTWITLSLGQF